VLLTVYQPHDRLGYEVDPGEADTSLFASDAQRPGEFWHVQPHHGLARPEPAEWAPRPQIRRAADPTPAAAPLPAEDADAAAAQHPGSVRLAASILGVDARHIEVREDPRRHWPTTADPASARAGVVLTVRDPRDPTTYTFVPTPDTPDQLLLIFPCLRCDGPVPMCRIARLADLGAFLEDRTGIDVDFGGPQPFYGDPDHTPECGYGDPQLAAMTAPADQPTAR
jgi:hypothetical protein